MFFIEEFLKIEVVVNIINEKKLENATIELEIEVPAERVEEEFKVVFKKIQQTAKIDGFRKGKVPLPMLEARYSGYASEEVAESLIKSTVGDAIKEKELNPIAVPSYEFNGLNRGEALRFKAIVELFPNINIGNYKGVPIEERTCNIQDSDVEKEIENLRTHFKKTAAKPEGTELQHGDMVKLRYVKLNIDNVERTYSAVIGEDADEYAIEQHLGGMKSGEEKEISITYPADYVQTDLAGKEVLYKVKVEEITRDELPELNDDLAREAQFESVEDMRNKARELITHFVDGKTRGEAKSSVINKIILESAFEIPETVIKAEIDSIFKKEKERMAERMGYTSDSVENYTVEDVAAIAGLYPDEYSSHLRVQAENSVKVMLVISEIVKKENLKVSDEEYREYVLKQAEEFGRDIEEFEEIMANSDFRKNVEKELTFNQAIDFLYDNAAITKLPPVTVEELLKQDRQERME
ncbi:MAG: trigger factor [Leptospirales bacterium]|nr:trigger factor [Leptospirales bacterium]